MVEIAVPLTLLFLLLAMGVPVGFSMAIAGFVGVYLIAGGEVAINILGSTPHSTTTSLLLTTIPMFVLMAEFLANGRIVNDLFMSASLWLRRLPGGLAIATVGAGAALGSLSGSSTASAASLARVAVPEMREHGYKEPLALGSVAIAGTLSAMIPPSVVLIIYGIITETSIGMLFVAGIIPGVLTAVLFCLVIAGWRWVSPSIAPAGPSASWRARFSSLSRVIPAVFLLVVVLGALYAGAVTATEAGALGALGALVVSVIFGGLRWEQAALAVSRTVKTTAMIFIIVIGATIFSQFLALSRVTAKLADVLAVASVPSIVILIAVILIYLVLGAFMDTIGMLVLTLPVFFPLLTALGYDAVWLGIIVIKVAEIGLVTPPVGMNIFVAAGSASGDIRDAFAGASRFILVEFIVLILIVAFPSLVTYLPYLLHK
jgi:C4-dicarboxylate transporter DctM subunit